MDVATVECLAQLGFSQTEAKVYCTMVSEEKMNGYQIAKSLGTSRSSVYAALENLLDKGAIVSIPGQTSEYAVVEPVQLIDKITSKYKKSAETAKNLLVQLSMKRRASNFFCNIQGLQNLVDEVKSMIDVASKEILINSSMDLKPIAEKLREAKKRGVRIIIFSWLNLELYDLDVEFYCNDLSFSKSSEKRFIMVVDNNSCILCSNDRNEFIPYKEIIKNDMNVRSLLTSLDKDFLGVRTDNRLLVNLMAEHIHFDIYLNKLRIKNGGEVITPDIFVNSIMENGD